MLTIERALADHVNITTLTTDDDGRGRRLSPGTRLANPPGVRRVYARKWLDTFKVAPGAVAWLWRNLADFDVVHVHAMFSFTSSAATMIARLKGVPYVIRPLGTLNRYGMAQRRPALKRLAMAVFDGPALRHAAAVHFTSTHERDEARLLGVNYNSIIIPLGIAVEPQADAIGKADCCTQRILFLSRIDPVKNLPVLLESVALLQPRFPKIELAIAGDGAPHYVQELKERARMLGIENRVSWVGYVDGAQKSEHFAGADIFVLPSYSENFGIAAAEAMLAGLPCVLSPGVAIAEPAAAENAVLVCEAKPQPLADALAGLLLDPDRRAHMGRSAQDYARTHFSTEAMAARLVALYADISKQHPRKVS